MLDLEDILKAIEKVLSFIFGPQTPPQVLQALGYTLAVLFALLGVWSVLFILSRIKTLFVEHFLPLLYNPQEKRRSTRRQRFADHVESEIRRLNNLEEWSDHRFTELEAEVEAEGRRRAWHAIAFWHGATRGLRRERSLSRALQGTFNPRRG